MATETATTTTRKRTTKPKQEAAVQPEKETPVMSASEPVIEKMTVKQIDPNQIVTVRNGFQGKLLYKSKRTGERFEWDGFGDEQDMELSELKNARNSCKTHFAKNWFMFDEDWIVDYLGVSKLYKNAIPISTFDEFFTKPASEIEKALSEISDGQKQSVAYRARQLIQDGVIDSNKTIQVIEKVLHVDLLDR